ncbi:NFACT RNA binding domain-containing protein [Rufibacter psychrotolerans]|uniref:NFACT RNA binding domain-containing protein n=1 Tax=Rufibacter psychrotolerans TaxID=2812556 RepID=UPI0019670933|nr:NFACT RNA binding domain-containing protein [Rufibacter sp. SYSU D00308]
MHQNYYFLRQLARQLDSHLRGYTLQAAFSQEKDELMLAFYKGEEEFYLKAIQTSTFSSLQFPRTFHRAKQNSVDLFPDLLHQQVLEVRAHRQERSFYIRFTQERVLLFKLFGNRSNVVLFVDGEATELFHRKLSKDLELDYRQMDRDVLLDKELFLEQPQNLRKLLPTLGEVPGLYLQEKGYDTLSPEEQWEQVQEMVALLENPTAYYLTYLHKQFRLSLLPVGEIQETWADPISALNAFVPQYRAQEYFQKNYSAVHRQLSKQLDGAQKIWWQIQEQLEKWDHGTPYAQTADIIMANLTNIPPGSKEVELYDFYHDTHRLVSLKSTETPQKTAERLYKKAKNQKIEHRLLEERAARKEQEVTRLSALLQQLESIETAPQLRTFLKQNAPSQAVTQVDLPYHTFELMGFKILVGKNSKANDKLTLKHTHKDDLWLHAKDVPGSHVVIKYQAGKAFPAPVLEAAAQLAAFYSKRRNDSLCPVLYTPKKYVRKAKGAAPGSVIVEREKVLLVKPENPFR